MNVRRLAKMLGFAGAGLPYVRSLGLIGLMMLLSHPLSDDRLPLRPFFEVWLFLMLVALAALGWRHREPGVRWLAVAVGATPFGATALIAAGLHG